jgi:hypothetical protein
MEVRTDVALLAAPYASKLRGRHAFADPERDLVAVTEPQRIGARAALASLLAVAEFDVASNQDLALVESLYADPRDREGPRPPWQLAFVRLVREIGLLVGRGPVGVSEPAHFVERLRARLEERAPDAPSQVVRLDDLHRAVLERRLANWRTTFTWDHPEGTFAELDMRAQTLARIWSETCGVRWAAPSQLTRRRGQTADDATDGTTKRAVYWPVPRRRSQLTPSLVAPVEATRIDADAIRAHDPLQEPAPFDPSLAHIDPGMNEPTSTHWRVAASVATELEALADRERRRPFFEVDDALREVARRHVESLLQVGWFTHARPVAIATATTVFERKLAIDSRGLRPWQAHLVWSIEQRRDALNALLAQRNVAAIDAMLLAVVEPFEAELDASFVRNSETLGRLAVPRIGEGPGSSFEASAHVLALRWCEGHGLPLPMYPSRQRPAGAARRLAGGGRKRPMRNEPTRAGG